MKTKLLRKLRKKAKNKCFIIDKGWIVDLYSNKTFKHSFRKDFSKTNDILKELRLTRIEYILFELYNKYK